MNLKPSQDTHCLFELKNQLNWIHCKLMEAFHEDDTLKHFPDYMSQFEHVLLHCFVGKSMFMNDISMGHGVVVKAFSPY